MAMKDWKKIGASKWENDKEGYVVRVNYEEFAGKKSWILQIDDGYGTFTERKKSFSDATKSAKKFMNNPKRYMEE